MPVKKTPISGEELPIRLKGSGPSAPIQEHSPNKWTSTVREKFLEATTILDFPYGVQNCQWQFRCVSVSAGAIPVCQRNPRCSVELESPALMYTVRPREECRCLNPHHRLFVPYAVLEIPDGLAYAPWDQQKYYRDMFRVGRGKRHLSLAQDRQVEEAWNPYLWYVHPPVCRVFNELRQIKVLGEDPPAVGVIHQLWPMDPQPTYVETLGRRLIDMLRSSWTDRLMMDLKEREAAEALIVPPEPDQRSLNLAAIVLEPEDFEDPVIFGHEVYLPEEGDLKPEEGFFIPPEIDWMPELE